MRKEKLINKKNKGIKASKKILALVMAAGMVAGTVGCAGIGSNDTDNTTGGVEFDKRVTKLNVVGNAKVDDKEVSKEDVKECFDNYKKHYLDYTLDLFKEIRNDEELSFDEKENAMISPYSIQVALGMTTLGAKGDTKHELDRFLYGNVDGDSGQKCISYYSNQLKSYKESKLSKANSIWYNTASDINFNNEYLNYVSDFYRCELYGTAFSEITKDDINSWISEHTDKMINDVVDYIDEESRMFLINAVAFDAKWLNEFDEAYTSKKDFLCDSCEVATVDMMSGSTYGYIEDKNVTGFVKEYKNGYSYVALRPKNGMMVDDYIGTLDGEKIMNMLDNIENTMVHINMPKYSSDSKFNLKEMMQRMGVELAFSPSADFSNMYIGVCDGLYIDNVIHQTHIDVDEAGTKAAAATVVEMSENASCMEGDVKIVDLDRSFVYMVIDNETKLPVFFGVVDSL